MKPPVLRPSSLPALAVCPCYSPDQSEGEQQKSEGTKRHDALAKYLEESPDWRGSLGSWDAGGVEWAGEYIRTHAPTSSYPLEIEQRRSITLSTFDEFAGTPDVTCGPVLFDLKGRDVDSYREQMAGYVMLAEWMSVEIHVLYATERRAERFRMTREEAESIVEGIAAGVSSPTRMPVVSDWCGWCANRKECEAFAAAGAKGARDLGVTLPAAGNIEAVQDADGLAELKRAADVLSEWAKTAKAHVLEMATKRGVVATGYRIAQRKGSPSIEDAWAAIQAAGLTPEQAASAFSLRLGGLVEAYAAARGVTETAAKREVEQRLGPLVIRGATVHYLTPI